jgi:hypothetical protein
VDNINFRVIILVGKARHPEARAVTAATRELAHIVNTVVIKDIYINVQIYRKLAPELECDPCDKH